MNILQCFKIRTKFLIWLLSLGIVLITILTGITLNMTRYFSERDSIVMVDGILEQVNQIVYFRLSDINNLAIRLHSTREVLTVLGNDSLTLEEHDRDSIEINRLLLGTSRLYNNLFIQIFDFERTITDSARKYESYNRFSSFVSTTLLDFEDLQKDPLFLKLQNSGGARKGKYVLGHVDKKSWSSASIYLVLMRMVFRGEFYVPENSRRGQYNIDLDYEDPIGVVFITIHKGAFENIFKQTDLLKAGNIYLVNEEGELLSSSDRNIPPDSRVSPFSVKQLKKMEENKQTFDWVTIDNQEYLLCYRKVKEYGLFIYTLQQRKFVLKNYYTLRNVFFITSIILLFLVSGVAFFFAYTMSRPIEYLTSKMAYYIDAISGTLTDPEVEESISRSVKGRIKSADEIGEMTQTFTRMLNKIREMNSNLVEKERIKNDLLTARRIQLTVLPSIINSAFFEMSARMIPTEEVGGDYYDYYCEKNGRSVYIIGDVSGHGLNAGLIMFMVQASVRSILIANPSLDILELVQRLNTFFYKNIIERMGLEECMTFLAVEGFKDGRFGAAGLHSNPLVYRKESGICEEIPIEGMYLGLMKNINTIVKKTPFVLGEGDILVLYTDGITEARNKEGDFFDIHRLKEIIIKNSTLSAKKIQKSVIETVLSFMDRQKDDMSIFVIKKK